jgi:hypothetical protein
MAKYRHHGAYRRYEMTTNHEHYYFFSLATGRRLNRNRWTELPMPAGVINRVQILARRGLALEGLPFADRNGNNPNDGHTNGDDADKSDDETWNPNPHGDNDDDDARNDDIDDCSGGDAATLGDTTAGVNHNDAIAVPENNFPENDFHDTENDPPNDAPENNATEHSNALETDEPTNDGLAPIPEHHETENNANNDETKNEVTEIEETENNTTQNDDTDNGNNQQALNERMGRQYGEQDDKHNLRPRRPCDYSHLHTMLEHIIMTQYTINKGLKVIGDAGTEAVLSELQQLHDWKAVEPKSGSAISCKERPP